MKRNYCLSLVLLALFGVSAPFAANAAVESVLSSQSTQQAKKITGKVLDAAGGIFHWVQNSDIEGDERHYLYCEFTR